LGTENYGIYVKQTALGFPRNIDKGGAHKTDPKSNPKGDKKARGNVLSDRRKMNPRGGKTLPRRLLGFDPLGLKKWPVGGSVSDPVFWAISRPTGADHPRFSRSVSDPVFWVIFRPPN